MIKLTKGPTPKILVDNATAWTAELLDALARGEDVSSIRSRKYGHKDIKDALKIETHRKCAYCESKPLHVDYGDVEHIVPKSTDPNLTYVWSNLTLACSVCNTKKSNKQGLLDPYVDKVEEAIEFYGPLLLQAPNHNGGYVTIRALDLNRADLLERRAEKLTAFHQGFEKVVAAADENARMILTNALIEEGCSPESEFSACLASFISDEINAGRIVQGKPA